MQTLDAWKQGIRNFINNWRKPIPLATKCKMLIRNEALKLVRRETCCGHHGEPGC